MRLLLLAGYPSLMSSEELSLAGRWSKCEDDRSPTSLIRIGSLANPQQLFPLAKVAFEKPLAEMEPKFASVPSEEP
jgi:hypothetical protein